MEDQKINKLNINLLSIVTDDLSLASITPPIPPHSPRIILDMDAVYSPRYDLSGLESLEEAAKSAAKYGLDVGEDIDTLLLEYINTHDFAAQCAVLRVLLALLKYCHNDNNGYNIDDAQKSSNIANLFDGFDYNIDDESIIAKTLEFVYDYLDEIMSRTTWNISSAIHGDVRFKEEIQYISQLKCKKCNCSAYIKQLVNYCTY